MLGGYHVTTASEGGEERVSLCGTSFNKSKVKILSNASQIKMKLNFLELFKRQLRREGKNESLFVQRLTTKVK